MADRPLRILFVFASLGGGGVERQIRELAGILDPARYRLDAIVCLHLPGLPNQALAQMSAAGIQVDTHPYTLSLEDTIAYLAGILPEFDCVVACQPTPDLAPALERLHLRPLLIELATLLSGEPTAALDATRRIPADGLPLFKSYFQGGFECSTHRRGHDRARIDVIAATRHDVLAASDYASLQAHGLLTVRDGLRWHLIEHAPGVYDWSSVEDQLAGAAATGTEVIWDLLHYGWPDDVDVWRPDFVGRFAAFAAAAARTITTRLPGPHFYAPVNEISFLSWGGGDAEYMNPFATARGFELKAQLARAAISAMDAIRHVDPNARFVHADPVIHIATDPVRPDEAAAAEGHRQAQFQAWDMIAGKSWPQLGGRPDLLDIVGVNFYHNNQWMHGGPPIARGHPSYRSFHRILAETYARYGRPIFVAETGIEGEARPGWLAHICDEVALAIDLGVPVAGICLYPILDHPGWDDDRDCPNGLLRTPPGGDARISFMPLAQELAYQRRRFESAVMAVKSCDAPTRGKADNHSDVDQHRFWKSN